MNEGYTRERRLLIRGGTYSLTQIYRSVRGWLLAMAGAQGQGRLWDFPVASQEPKSPSGNMVCSEWSRRGCICHRPSLQSAVVCEPSTFTPRHAVSERAGELEQRSSSQQGKDTLQGRTSIRQKVWKTAVLLNLSRREGEAPTRKMGEGALAFRSLTTVLV